MFNIFLHVVPKGRSFQHLVTTAEAKTAKDPDWVIRPAAKRQAELPESLTRGSKRECHPATQMALGWQNLPA